MRVALKYLILVSFIMLFYFNLHAQVNTSAFKLFFEKIYLHTDKDVYTPGDIIWFKAYLVNGQTNMPIGTSGNLYVELISAKPEILDREIIRLDAGSGQGDFLLTDSIPTGRYTLRAYTNWMRNFGNNFVFEKNIDVYNTKAPLTAPNPVNKVGKNKQFAISPGGTNSIVRQVNVRFFPEGGSLVEGLNALVGVKAEDAMGNGLALKGVILNDAGDTVSYFNCDTVGLGMLSILPLNGQTYKAWFNYKNTNYVVALPLPLLKGVSLSIRKADTVLTAIVCANNVAYGSYTGHNFTLTARHSGKVLFAKIINMTNNQFMLRIATSVFPEGLSSITVYDDQNKPHCERLVYIHHPGKTPLRVATDKQVYQPKSKVTLKLKLSDTLAKANLSVAVVDAGVVPAQYGNIENYLLLTSELKGNIEHPERYFDTTNVNRFKQLDLLLMTQGWRDFLWRRMADSVIRIAYAAEPYLTLSGRLRQKFANKPLRNINISLTAFKAKGNKIFNSKTDSLGKYYFDGLQLYGPQTVSLAALDSKGKSTGLILMDSLYRKPIPLSTVLNIQMDTTLRVTKAIERALVEREKIKRQYRYGDTIHLKTVQIKAPRVVQLEEGTAIASGYPDQSFQITNADEYFESVSNWMIHNVRGAHVSSSAGDDAVTFDVELATSRGIFSFRMEPTFFVNGKEVYAPMGMPYDMKRDIMATYYNLSMDKVKKITVRHMLGTVISYNGDPMSMDIYLVYLTVTDNALDKVQFGKLTAQVNGYNEPRTFYKPIYDTPQDFKKKDYRTTIHWEPNIRTVNGEATVNFYNADPKTMVRIVVEGITDKGLPIAATVGYVVK